jgi:hypothetical protein
MEKIKGKRIMKSLLSTMFTVLLTGVTLLTASKLSLVHAQTPALLCGREVPFFYDDRFWAFTQLPSQESAAPSIVTVQASAVSTAQRLTSETAIQTDIISNDQFEQRMVIANAYIVPPVGMFARRDEEHTLRIKTNDGRDIQVPAPTGLRYWRMIPTNEPNLLRVFGYQITGIAFIIDIQWTGNEAILGNPQVLPFEFSPLDALWQMLSFSPDGQYIAYVEQGTGQLTYLIYSFQEQRIIFSLPIEHMFFRPVWVATNNLIALIPHYQPNNRSTLITIRSDGGYQSLGELSALFSPDLFVGFASASAKLSSAQILFWVEIGDANRLFMFNLPQNRLIDLCIQHSAGGELLDVRGTNALYVMYGGQQRQLLAVSAETGNFAFTEASQSIFSFTNSALSAVILSSDSGNRR